ncbi:MAG: hypothetical protein IPP69_02745 [Flavobacteriales bacterium]|nr:hypothetical protein [Flavobacteriales bacterium]
MNSPFVQKKIAFVVSVLFLLLPVWGFSQKTDEDYATAPSQTKPKPKKEPFKDRLVYGGNIGGYLGNVTFVQLNPMVGYRVKDWLVPGIGLNYLYASSQGYSQNVYGASTWLRVYPFEQFFAHTELEYLNVNYKNSSGQSLKVDVPVWLVGAGYQENGFGVMVLFDLIGDPYSPYSTPVFRIGGLIGF